MLIIVDSSQSGPAVSNFRWPGYRQPSVKVKKLMASATELFPYSVQLLNSQRRSLPEVSTVISRTRTESPLLLQETRDAGPVRLAIVMDPSKPARIMCTLFGSIRYRATNTS
ncbi:hypothetical protein CORC01_12244 [Colletotrichum orchidophilum]|uniref:Uncharacterized protein n=1 Tax=Colletotrichum orchidophilum TaxID=1209926 RepID=A0A1G4ATN8_9PEZI|nr:uncharacterized protein CORC01_12244 [Colletotrichum orchidophilum]OHE92453.1 hypothetical protein CORC01_12244 [Colletotrichum orchidophilum]